MFDLRHTKVLVLGARAMLLVLTMPSFSTAIFTSGSSNTATVSAAADWTPPTVELAGALPYLRGSATLTPSAFDRESGIAKLSVEHRNAATAPWTTLCAEGSASYPCTWDTTLVADGRYVVQATAVDGAGYSASTRADITVDNTPPTVTLHNPGSALQGTVTLQTQPFDATSGVVDVTIQTAPRGTTSWTDLCATSGAPWSCDFDTSKLPNGTHSFRAVATDAAGNTGTSNVVATTIGTPDTTGPKVSIVDVTVRNGMLTITAEASDDSGVRSVSFEHRRPGGNRTWETLCSGVQSKTTPDRWYCAVSVPDNGQTYFRAIATDTAGNTTTSEERHIPINSSTNSNGQTLEGNDLAEEADD